MSDTAPIPNDVALRAQAGDKAALDAMVPRLQDKADFVAKRLKNVHVSQEDLIQDAIMAAIEALPSWRPEKAAYDTYAQNVMRRAVLNGVSGYYIGASVPWASAQRYWHAVHTTRSLDEALASLEGVMTKETFLAIDKVVTSTVPAHLVEGVGYEGSTDGEESYDEEFYYKAPPLQHDAEDELVDRVILDEHLQTLLPRERFIIESAMRQDTDKEIAQVLGLDRSTVSALRRGALVKLKESIEEDQG